MDDAGGIPIPQERHSVQKGCSGKAGTVRLKTGKLHYGECLNNATTMMKRWFTDTYGNVQRLFSDDAQREEKTEKTQQGCLTTAAGKTRRGKVSRGSGMIQGWREAMAGLLKSVDWWLAAAGSGAPASLSLMSVMVSAGEERTRTRRRIHRTIQDRDKSISVYTPLTVHKRSSSYILTNVAYIVLENVVCSSIYFDTSALQKKEHFFFSHLASWCDFIHFHLLLIIRISSDRQKNTHYHHSYSYGNIMASEQKSVRCI